MSLQALLAVLFWGASFPAAKLVLREVGPLTLLVVRYTIGGGLLLAVAALTAGGRPVRRNDLGAFVALAVLLTVFHQGAQVFGLVHATATNSGWLFATAPVFIALLAGLVLAERLSRAQWVGMGLGLLGSVVVVTQADLGGGILLSSSGLGELMVLESAVAWAGYTVAGKGLLQRYPPITVSAYGMVIGMALAAPVWLLVGGGADLGRLTLRGWAAALYLATCSTALAYLLWYRAMRQLSAGVTGAYMFLQPLVVTVLARLLLGETLTAATIGGGLMILAGVYWVTWPARELRR